MDIQTIGIVGAGQMGNGIAHVMALAGYDVLLTDVSAEALQKAIDTITSNLDRQVGRGKVAEADRDATLARIKTTQTLSDLGQSDLIIEAATERETVKQDLDVKYIVDLDHPSGQQDRSAREIYGISLYEPRPGDAAG